MLTVETVLEAPQLAAGGANLQVQGVAVEQAIGRRPSPGVAGFGVAQSHVALQVFSVFSVS